MTTTRPPHVLVSGGSIAGLSVAYWLARTGWQVTLVEKAPAFRDGGQNVDVRGVGHQVLERMDLVETVRGLNTGETGTVVVDESDAVVARMPDVGPDSSTAELEVLRGDLARALLDRLPEGVEVRYDEVITEVDEHDDHVGVTTSKHERDDYDLLVVAEGVRSSTRDLLFDDVTATPLDVDMVFGTIARLATDDSKWRWLTTTGGRQAHLRPDNHGTTRAILAFSPSRSLSDLDREAVQRELERRFDGVGWAAPRILQGFATSDDVYADTLTQVRAPHWHRGRVCLVGDAAWCVTPLGGGGATLALTSGYVLAAYLSQTAQAHARAGTPGDPADQPGSEGVEAALERFETWLRPLVDEVQKMPPGMVRMAYPQSAPGLRASRLFQRVLTSRPFKPLAAKMTQVADTDQALPELHRVRPEAGRP